MKITVFCAFSFGTGDFSFGRKTAEALQKKFPDAEISLVTLPTTIKSDLQKEEMAKILPSFNKDSKFPVMYLDEYENKMRAEGKPITPDLIAVGPVLNFDPGYIDRVSANNKQTPIFTMQEYDFDPDFEITAKQAFKDRGYTKVTGIPTGINPQLGSAGMFVEASLVAFNKNDGAAKLAVFAKELPVTGQTILDGRSVADYSANTDVSVSYSHNNAERLLAVHTMLKEPVKNVDLIVMGENKLDNPVLGQHETENHDRRELVKRTDALLAKGFGSVVYQESGKEPEILGKSDNGGPVYRVLHTNRVTPSEAIALRKIGGSFGGATGDQSLSEAMSSTDVVMYETYSHKTGIAAGFGVIAKGIDPTGKLERTVHLLSHAKNEAEYKELATSLKDPKVCSNLKEMKQIIIKNDLTKNLPAAVEACVAKKASNMDILLNQAKETFNSIFKVGVAIINNFVAPMASAVPTVAPPSQSTGTANILSSLTQTTKVDPARPQQPKAPAISANAYKPMPAANGPSPKSSPESSPRMSMGRS